MDTVFLALRVVVALGAVFGALLFAHRWITKGRPGSQPRNRQIAVVARQGLGAKAGVAVVDAGGRRYLLGVTEHAVTVLDTLGAADAGEPSLVAAQPVPGAAGSDARRGAVGFEQTLRTVLIATADVPVILPGEPRGPIPQPVPVLPGSGAARAVPGPVRPGGAVSAVVPGYASRRALREAEQQAAERSRTPGPLAGSVLSPGTWRQTFDALKKFR